MVAVESLPQPVCRAGEARSPQPAARSPQPGTRDGYLVPKPKVTRLSSKWAMISGELQQFPSFTNYPSISVNGHVAFSPSESMYEALKYGSLSWNVLVEVVTAKPIYKARANKGSGT